MSDSALPSPAAQRAREVVGLYGDPDSTWGIGLDTQWSRPLATEDLQPRAAALAADFPHLGRVPRVALVDADAWDGWRAAALASGWEGADSLIRLAARTDGRRLMVVAHHGVIDGFGMVAVLAAVSGRPIATRARGVGAAASPHSFLGSGVTRVAEALLSPPPRFSGHGTREPGEHIAERTLPHLAAGTAVLAHTVAGVHARWPGSRAGARPLVVSGVSRRESGGVVPDRQTGYVRFRVDPAWDLTRARAEFAQVVPEPDFPETSVGGIAPRVIRLLRNRLGATAQLSNLGVIEAEGLETAALFPAVSGPAAVCLGVVTTSNATTLTLRTRRTDFSAAETARLLGDVVDSLLAATQ